jgi:hypothetical protein
MMSDSTPTWDGVTKAETLHREVVRMRSDLADAAKAYRWPEVLGTLREHPEWVNTWRLDGPSWFTPLHQAAHGGASSEVVEQLLALGAWRSLETAWGERAVDIAERQRHRHLLEVLAPSPRQRVPPGVLRKIQGHFHAVIRGRAEDLVREHALRLPDLEPLLELEPAKMWFPVPGMYGGFSYHLGSDRALPTLIVESWCRVVGGSGQRHEVTGKGSALVDEGFV